MQVLIQEKYQKLIFPKIANLLNSFSESTSSIFIGNVEYLKENKHKNNVENFLILISDPQNQSITFLNQLAELIPIKIFDINTLDGVTDILNILSIQINKKNQIQLVKSEIQKKRKTLEKLNDQLNIESEKQVVSLEQSHQEESQKNINEKSLLHFLDFVQSESINEDFLNILLRFIWKDFKKIGRIYQIGVGLKTISNKSNIFTFDGLNENTATVSIDFKSQALASQLASFWGRPVGKILTWSLSDFSRDGILFIEVVDQQLSTCLVENYFKERLQVLSIYLDRWMIEKEYEVIVDRWNRTFNSFSGFVHVIDEEFNIYHSNYYKNDKEQTGKKCYQVLASKMQPCESCPLYKSNSSEFILKDGVKVKTHSSEFNYNSKKYFFVIYEDVTQLHQLKSQMIQSEKMSALGRLGNHLAHELNNPLTGIKSYVQSLLDEPNSTLSNTVKSDLNEILKAAIRSQRIIKNFIDFSHKSEPKLEKIIFSEVLQNALTLLKSVLRPHRLFVDIKPTEVMMNSHDLQQVIFNIVKNSCQAMATYNKSIGTSVGGILKIYEEERADKILFHIEDSGPGFDETILKNIFEPFMTTKKQGEGTGLGLYLSKKLMNNMNADLQVSADFKQGAKISLIFDKL